MSNDARAQILQAIDLVELVSQTVALKRRGKDYLGLCPFHQEKTPSFHVSPSRQSFYCFGCKAGGTAFDFVMKRDRIEFREALEILARQAGIELPRFGGGPNQKPGERQALLDAHSAAAVLFNNQLNAPQGVAARDYLAKRGFTQETLRKFQVGLALDAWDGLLKSAVGRKFSPETLVLAGLVKARQQGGGFYDTFRNRIMFPIRNESGQIIAFGGRVMPGSDDPAKYLNSPETPLFNKSRAIFGLDLARQRIVETRTVAIVEGYTDSIMSHQFGATNVVSVLGTALTEQHVTVLRRFADRIVLLFDADAAGDAAVDRVVQLFLTQPVEIAVASIPDGLDPDEFLLKYGVEGMEKLLGGATDALEYAWRQLRRRMVSQEGELTGQQKAVEQYLGLLAGARGSGPVDALRWGGALVRVSRLTQIPVEELNRYFPAKRSAGKQVREESGTSRPAAVARPAQRTGVERAERQVLGLLLIEPARWHGVQLTLHVEDFATPELKRLAEVYWNHQRDEGEPVFQELLAALPEEGLVSLAIELATEVEDLPEREKTLADALGYLEQLRQRKEEKKIVGELQGGEKRLSEQDEVELLKKLQETRARTPDLRRFGA